MSFLSRYRWWRRLQGGEWVKKRDCWFHTIPNIHFSEHYAMPTCEDITHGMDDDQKRRWNAMWADLPEHERQRIQTQHALIWWLQ